MRPEDAWRLGVKSAMSVTALHFTEIKDQADKAAVDALLELQRKFSDLYCSDVTLTEEDEPPAAPGSGQEGQ